MLEPSFRPANLGRSPADQSREEKHVRFVPVCPGKKLAQSIAPTIENARNGPKKLHPFARMMKISTIS
jgi:hypothetical protein